MDERPLFPRKPARTVPHAQPAQALADYGLLTLLVILAYLGALQLFGDNLGTMYDRVVSDIVAVMGV